MDFMRYAGFLLLAAGLMPPAGCTTVDPATDYDRVEQFASEATGVGEVYRPEREAGVGEIVTGLLADGLTVDEAARICLINNPTLQAGFMELGMARADFVQAGLFSNPYVGISARLPDGGGLANIESGIAQNIAEIWQIPVRKAAAARALDRAVIELAREAADLAALAKGAYYAAVGADERLEIARENATVAQELLDLTVARQQAGAANELDVNLSRNIALDGEIAVERSRLEAGDARRSLATVLGLVSRAGDLVLIDRLFVANSKLRDEAFVVTLAKERRLDIRAARLAVGEAEARLREEYRSIFPVVEIGLELERADRRRQGGRDVLADTVRSSIANGRFSVPEIQAPSARRSAGEQDTILGPSLGFELPLFDQNQAQIAKAEYALEQARKALDALDRSVTQEVLGVLDRARTAWTLMALYRDRSVPLARSGLELSRESYRAGQATFLSVLEAQRSYLAARTGYVDAAQAAAIAVPELERSVGVPILSLTTVDSGERSGNPE